MGNVSFDFVELLLQFVPYLLLMMQLFNEPTFLMNVLLSALELKVCSELLYSFFVLYSLWTNVKKRDFQKGKLIISDSLF